jgi:hypothetical protein
MRLLSCLVFAVVAAAYVPAEKITFEALLDEMTDLERLAVVPDPAYTCKQFSSYDQRSTDAAVLTDENWFANGDRGQYLRKEQRDGKDEFVLMDAAGPGAIMNIWSANPVDAGTMIIYLDGDQEPEIEMALTDLVGGGKEPFIKPISIELAKGWNSYLPIPYGKHCKVTTSKPDFYYHIDYRTYAKGTKVETYTAKLAAKSMDKIKAIATKLNDPESAVTAPEGQPQDQAGTMVIPAGERAKLEFIGPGAIHDIRMNVAARDLEAALRGTLLEITFDDHATPDVLTPLGDFFGTAPGINKYKGLPTGVSDDGSLYAHWIMPFKSTAIVRFINTTKEEVSLTGNVSVVERAWTDNALYFRAKWRGVTEIPTRPRQDFNFLDTTGSGRFVGVHMHITNPVADWWGEGDEKIYVDGETFPSWFGTGSEDYFGYAWCSPELYSQAYHAQSRVDGPGNFGHSSNNRYHIIDDIPFTTSFKFDFEVWHWAECNVSQSIVAYWYEKGNGKDTFSKPTPEELIIPVPPKIKGVDGAIEGETMKVISVSGGTHAVQGGFGNIWSRATQLWWMNGKPGDTLVLGFKVEKAGTYEIFGNFTKAVDYGIAAFAVNGDKASDSVDFFEAKGVKASGELSLGVHALTAGENTITITIKGANPSAKPSHMVGIDYLRPVAK